jgi:hypothetical protein
MDSPHLSQALTIGSLAFTLYNTALIASTSTLSLTQPHPQANVDRAGHCF